MEIKIPLYNVLNMFLTGFVFIGGAMFQDVEKLINFIGTETFTKLTTMSEVLLVLIVVSIVYEVGLILNRIGSVILEPILKKIKIIPYDDRYAFFREKSKKFPIMNTLSREYALSRTGIAEFLILAIMSGVKCEWGLTVIFLCVSLIYLLSCRKHAAKIVALINKCD